MPFELRKLSDYGSANPIVARVSYQWVNLLPWYDLAVARRHAVGEALLLQVQPRLLAAKEIEAKHQPAAAAGRAEECGQLIRAFAAEARLALDAFAPIFAQLLGRNAPVRNYAALAKWAAAWFGAEDPLAVILRSANQEWIRDTYRLTDLLAVPNDAAGAGVSIPVQAGAMRMFDERTLRFVEESLAAALRHVPTLSPIVLGEIPEAERDAAAPVRFRALTRGLDGKFTPAGKPSETGTPIPELQRMLQQGRGRPIIASKFNGVWFVASGSKLYHSPRWKHFHDFLGFYIKDVLGGPWANIELKKPRVDRHPLMVWYEDVVRYMNEYTKRKEGAPMTALVAAYMGLAYDLYLISHNNGKVHERLVERLQHRDQFYGAYFEARVTGAMIRAGFDIELEDETNGKRSHCEFTATHRASGQKLSVEAKFRHSTQQPPDVARQLYNALAKDADHPRLVFLEVNDTLRPPEEQARLLMEVLGRIREFEAIQPIKGAPAPPAYLVISNNPPATVERPFVPAYLFEGYKMDDFRVEGQYPSLRSALEARERHAAINALMKSMRENTAIPFSFDGEVQAFAEKPPANRLLIGHTYLVPSTKGMVQAVLLQGNVAESEKLAYCIVGMPDGSQGVVTIPLSEQEIRAYRESPQTFFGREEPKQKAENPLELYDLMLAGYRDTAKDRLVELLAETGIPPSTVSSLTQQKLAELLAERMTESIVWQSGLGVKAKVPDSGSA